MCFSAFLPICMFSDVLLVTRDSHTRRTDPPETGPVQIRASLSPQESLVKDVPIYLVWTPKDKERIGMETKVGKKSQQYLGN